MNGADKRPWEGYNKAVWIRSFAQLEQLTLVLRSEEETWKKTLADDVGVGTIEFVQPQENPEEIQRISMDFQRSFREELATPEVYPYRDVPVVALPKFRIRVQRIRRFVF